MQAPEFTTSEGHYGVGFDLMARVRIVENALLTQDDVASISYEVWDAGKPNAIETGTLLASAAVFDTLQTDNGWDSDVDSLGFNFLWPVAGALVPVPGRVYVLLVTITLNDGEKVRVSHRHTTWARA